MGETDVVATRKLCLTGRAGACQINSGNERLEHFSSACDWHDWDFLDMSWHVTPQFSAQKCRNPAVLAFLGTPWPT